MVKIKEFDGVLDGARGDLFPSTTSADHGSFEHEKRTI